MYKEDLALNNLQWLICHKTKPNIKKCEVLHIGSKNIKVDYNLRNRIITKVNENCDLRVGLDYTKLTIIFYLLYGGQIEWSAGWLEILFQGR